MPPHPDPPPGARAYLSLSEAARRIDGVSRADLARLVAARQLRTICLPGRTRHKVDLDEAIAAIEALKRHEVPPCPSTNRKNRRTGTMISSAKVVGITALREQRRNARH